MNRHIRIFSGLVAILIIGALFIGCSISGNNKGQGPLTPGVSDPESQSDTVQKADPEPAKENQPKAPAGEDTEQEDETPDGTASEPNPVEPSSSEPSDGASAEDKPEVPATAESYEETTPEAIQTDPTVPDLPPDQSATEPVISLEWELLAYADVTGDGLDEAIYLDKKDMEAGIVTLRVCDSSGAEIWNEEASISHAGWNSIFLLEQGGTYYLLQYNPYMGQGIGSYTYIVFLLEGADENVISGDIIDFDINGTKELDVPRMVYFAETVNTLLGESILLVSSEGGEFAFGPSPAEPFFERYSWLDLLPELYENNDDLETRLYKYSDYAIEKRKRYN